MNKFTFKLSSSLTGLLLTLGLFAGVAVDTQKAVVAMPMLSENPTTSASAMGLEGTSWILVDWTNEKHNNLAEMAEPITVNFLGGRVSGSSSCNRYVASYKIEGNQLQISPAATTRRACMGNIMDREFAYLAAFRAIEQYEMNDQGKLLVSYTTEAGSGMMTFAPQESGVLENRTWVLTAFEEGMTSRVPLNGTTITVHFTEDEVRGFSSCNQYVSSYARDGKRLIINPFATTRQACPSEIMRQEFDFLTALEEAQWYEITPQGQLRISYQAPGRAGVMMFDPQEET